MKSVDFTDRLYSVQTQNRFGLPNELGHITCGVSVLGDYNPMAGIYKLGKALKTDFNNLNCVLGFVQMGYNNIGTDYFKNKTKGQHHRTIIKCKHYVPSNPQTVPQQTWRNYFATVLASWQALTENEKDVWRKQSFPAHMSGWNRYAKHHLNARDL